ncbi:MAG: response regulator [Chitinophagaceae bacterium]
MTFCEKEIAEVVTIEKLKILKVLIIDDELDICYLLSGILRQKELKTSYVNTLSDAEVALKNDPPGLLFLDNHLPDGFGLDFIQHVKTNYPTTKIIMITAHDSAAERKKAFMEGVDFFISKPFTRELIYNTLEKIM